MQRPLSLCLLLTLASQLNGIIEAKNFEVSVKTCSFNSAVALQAFYCSNSVLTYRHYRQDHEIPRVTTTPVTLHYVNPSSVVIKLYTLLENPDDSTKLYGYLKCFTVSEGKIKAVDKAMVQVYLKSILKLGLFSDKYVNNELKWFDRIEKQLLKSGEATEVLTDKYFGINPTAVKIDLAQRKEKLSDPKVRLEDFFGTAKVKALGMTNTTVSSTFSTAGYAMKFGVTETDTAWLIDWIKQDTK